MTHFFEKFRFGGKTPSVDVDNQFVADALEQSKREGLRLTIQARLLILAVFGLLFVSRIPWPESSYYLLFIVAFALVGWMQLYLGRIGYPRAAIIALMLDAVILTYMMLGPQSVG